jgi:hypothetical protein
MPSARARELERTAIFLEFCTGTRIADKIVLTAYHCLGNRIPKWASGGGVKIKVADHVISPLVDEVVFWDKNPSDKGKLKFAQPVNRTCPGDSGGPTLGLENGDWYVVGVTSRVMPDMRHRFSWIIPLIRGKELPDYARYCGEYYTSERVTENLEFLIKGVQTLVARYPQVGSSLPGRASSRRRK